MVATNYTTVRNHLKDYCDLIISSGETVVVTRKENKNIIMMSLEQYNRMEKELRNAQYLKKLDRGFEQLYAGNGQVHDLIEE